MAAISTADFKNGICINHNHDIFMLVEFQHVKPGKGNAFVRTKLKSMTTGRVLEHTFPSGVRLEAIRVERRQYQYLYDEGDIYYFMNNDTFDQVGINEKLINNPGLLSEGLVCDIAFDADNETPLTCDLPATVVLEVTYTEHGLKGDTATNTLKPATVETGAQVKVPLFVNQGDKIKINTTDNSYIERAK
jgi:elongation factor P